MGDSPSKSRRNWLIFAFSARLLASMTHARWFHADEWWQTLEPANLIAHGFGMHSQEIGLHLRNLTWAAMLAGILKLSYWISPLAVDLRVFLSYIFCGLLDLLIFWGWLQVMDHDPATRNLSPRVKNAGVAFLLLPWFTIYESISPRAEHLSEISTWVALGCLAKQYWILAGIASVAIGAFRYPSFFIPLAIAGSIMITAFREKNFVNLRKFSIGIALGLVLFGLADGIIYGRPWESFWMYLQYNVFTGSSTQVFGHQGLETYRELFEWNWTTYKTLIPFSILIFVAFFRGLFDGLKTTQTWAICMVLYLIGHFLVPHKEGRFMIPIETLTRWSAFVGLVILWKPVFKKEMEKTAKLALQALLVLTLLINGGIFLHTLRADLWKERGTFLEINRHLQATPNTCAVITARETSSIITPFHDGKDFPYPALARLIGETRGLLWIEHPPQCESSDSVLLHIRKPWEREECTLLPSGILKFLPQTSWKWAQSKHLVDGLWYRCNASILQTFPYQKVTKTYGKTYGKIESLPPYGITAKELQNLGLQTSPPPPDAALQSLENPAHL